MAVFCVVATWDLCLIPGWIIGWLFYAFLMRLGRAQLSFPSDTSVTSVLVSKIGQGWFSFPQAKGHSMPHVRMAKFSFSKRGWPHSARPVEAVPGLCCLMNHAQPLSGNMLAGRSQNCAREQAYNRIARAGACQHMPWPSFHYWYKCNCINTAVP